MQVELPHHVRLIPQETEPAIRNAGIRANSLSEVCRIYSAVGIDVSKDKSAIAVLQPGDTVIRKPLDVFHTSRNLNELADYLDSLEDPSKIVTECTDRYHEPMFKILYEVGLFVSVVNPHLVKNFGSNSLRRVKSDPTDAHKIARYTLDSWAELRRCSDTDDTRTQLRTLDSQFSSFTKQKVVAEANLIALLDNTYPGANELFDSPTRKDGSEKRVDYTYSFQHVDYVCRIDLKTFTERYKAFCKKHHYIFQQDRPEKLSNTSKELVAAFPEEKTYKLLIQQSIQQPDLVSGHVEHPRQEMNALASTLPEYNTVMGVYGVGKTYGPQLIVEIGNVSRFTHREALTAFTDIDPGMGESDQHKSKGNGTSEVGSARLRKTLFQIMTTLLQSTPVDDPVYRFLDKKRAQGKPYYVYMTAGANKFLRVYYGKVKKCLRNLEQAE